MHVFFNFLATIAKWHSVPPFSLIMAVARINACENSGELLLVTTICSSFTLLISSTLVTILTTPVAIPSDAPILSIFHFSSNNNFYQYGFLIYVCDFFKISPHTFLTIPLGLA
jgi:hypothetical protein